MCQLQADLRDLVKETMETLKNQQASQKEDGRFAEPKGYPVTDDDLEKEALNQQFLYRSPTSTVMILPEEGLRQFYPKLMRLTHRLGLAHRIRIVTCAHNTPVWQVLRELQLKTRKDFFEASDIESNIDQLKDLQKEKLKDQNAADYMPSLRAFWQLNQQILQDYQEITRPLSNISLAIDGGKSVSLSPQELTLTIIRRGARRTFNGEIAHQLLTWSPKSVGSQVHFLAQFASQLRVHPDVTDDRAFLGSLFLEIDARSNPERRHTPNWERLPEKFAEPLKQILLSQSLEPQEIPAFLWEIAHHLLPQERNRDS